MHRWCNEVVKYYTGEPGFFGSKIAFTAKGKDRQRDLRDGLRRRERLHGLEQQLDEHPAGVVSVGGQIAYTCFMRNNPDLYVGPAGGGRPKKISSQRGMNTGASWSPDGSKLALTLSKDGNPDIYVINASDGAVIRRLTNDKAIDTSPAWSPDGSQIAFVSDRNGGPQIFVVPAGGGAAQAGLVQRQLQHDADVVAQGRASRSSRTRRATAAPTTSSRSISTPRR